MEADPDWFDASGADEEEENPLEADPNWFDASGAEEEDPVAHDREVLSFILARFQLEFETMSAISIAVLKEIVEATKRADPIPYHTSILSGAGWIVELLNGHPERIRTELGVHKHVFKALVQELKENNYTHSKHVMLEEKLGIFLYTCVTGLSIRHVGERFQRANSTISTYVFTFSLSFLLNICRYFKEMLFAFSSPGIYSKYVRLPSSDTPVHPSIHDNPKHFPFFQDAIGAIDGTHIACVPSADTRDAARNRKGFTSQNCLMCCDFDMLFTYVLSGWEGSVPDATIYYDARMTDLAVPEGKYYLADAGFPNCPQLLVPYRGQRYHLAEWGRGRTK